MQPVLQLSCGVLGLLSFLLAKVWSDRCGKGEVRKAQILLFIGDILPECLLGLLCPLKSS